MKRRAFLQLLGLAPAIPYFRIPAPDEDVAAMAWGDLTEEGFRYYMRLKRHATIIRRNRLLYGSWAGGAA